MMAPPSQVRGNRAVDATMTIRQRSRAGETERHPAASDSAAADWPAFFAPGATVTALPSWRRPRLIVETGTLGERWSAGRMYPAFRARARLARLFIRAASAVMILPSRAVEADDRRLEPVFNQFLPEATTLSLLIGTPGPGQKLTAECRDDRRRPVGYLKYAAGAVATTQLWNEAAVLKGLPDGAGPRLLGLIPWYRGLLLVTRPVEGRPVRARSIPPRALPSFTRSLRRQESASIYRHPWVRETGAVDALPRALEMLEGRPWNLTIQHGDLAAWNVRETDAGLQAFDWEYGTLSGFPYLDIAHFILQHAALIARWPAQRGAAAAAKYILSSADEDLSHAEAAALVELAAYDAFRHDPSPAGHPLQKWRHSIWKDGR